MHTVTMAEPAGGGRNPSQTAVNADYRTSMEILTRRGGLFWGLVLAIVGIIWLVGSLGYIQLNADLILPLLVILAGLYLVVTKALR